MASLSQQTAAEDAPGLMLPFDRACWFIVKAREFDAKDVSTSSDPGSNAVDDDMRGVLEDRPDDPVEEELRAFIGSLSEDERIELVALAWLGRDGVSLQDWESLKAEASRSQANANYTADYLLGEPLISNYVEEGLSMFGLSCADADETL